MIEDMPIDRLKQHAVVVYIDSGDCTEALLRSKLVGIEVFDGESESGGNCQQLVLVGFSTLLRPFEVVEFLLPSCLIALVLASPSYFSAGSLLKLRAVNGVPIVSSTLTTIELMVRQCMVA